MPEKDEKNKAYSRPVLTELTREQAIKLVIERKRCSEEEAAEFVDSLRRQQQHDAKTEKRKRSA